MKPIFWKWSLGFTLAALPLAGGCLQESVPTPIRTATFQPTPIALTDNQPAAEPAANGLESTNDITTAAATPVNVEAALPPNVRSSGPVSEIARLANSGVEESVILAYVTNSSTPFNLSADEIIYLKDIGVPAAVVTAMIQRDQELRGQTTAAESTLPAYAQTQPAAPTPPLETYANQPAPGDVAPQPDPSVAGPAPTYAAAPSAPPVDPTYSTFYSSLAPYGTWVDVAGYGWCWRPTVVAANPEWQPYLDDGRWMYTDNGWYWYSDYSWGWAPFHYGRWFRHHGMGWCWAPDVVWGPSWVSWRYSDAYCGWAPLPPAACYSPGFGFSYYGRSVGFSFDFGLRADCYAFVGWHGFHDHHLRGYAVPHNRVTQIYNKTVVINRFEGNNHTVINRGIAPDRVASLSKSEVRKVSIHEAGRESLRAGRGETLDANNRTLAVYRPKLSQASPGGVRVVSDSKAGNVRPQRPAAAFGQTRPSTPSTHNVTPSGSARNAGTPLSAGSRERASTAHGKSTPPPVSVAPTAPARPARTESMRPATPAPAPTTRQNSNPTRPAPNTTRPAPAPRATDHGAATPSPLILRGAQAGTGNQHAPAPTFSAPRFETPQRAQRSYRPASPAYSAPQPGHSAPAVSAPTPRSFSAPSYQAPSRNDLGNRPNFTPAPTQSPRFHGSAGDSPRSSAGPSTRQSYSAPTREFRATPSAPSGNYSPARGSGDNRRNRT